jgi:hypothetical protein
LSESGGGRGRSICDEKQFTCESLKEKRGEGSKLETRKGCRKEDWKGRVSVMNVVDRTKTSDEGVVIGESLFKGIGSCEGIKSAEGEDKRGVEAREEMWRDRVRQ